jgi:hypothetical protein
MTHRLISVIRATGRFHKGGQPQQGDPVVLHRAGAGPLTGLISVFLASLVEQTPDAPVG